MKGKLKSILCLILCILVFGNDIKYADAKNGDENSDINTGGDMDGDDTTGTDITTTDERKWFDERGFKLTTYVLATRTLDYMMNLDPDLQSYIVHSRPNMMVLDGKTSKSEENLSYSRIKSIIEKYVGQADYYDNNSENYIADYFQQLGRPLVVQTESVKLRPFKNIGGGERTETSTWYRDQLPDCEYTGMYSKPGVILSTTSPKYHVSQIQDIKSLSVGATKHIVEKYSSMSSSDLETILNNCRTEFEFQSIKNMKVEKDNGNKKVTLGNYVDMGTIVYENTGKSSSSSNYDLTEQLFGFDYSSVFKNTTSYATSENLKTMHVSNPGCTSNISNYTRELEYSVMAVQGAILTGMYSDGITIDGTHYSKVYSISNKSGLLTDTGNSKIEVKDGKNKKTITIRTSDLVDSFLSKYSCDGEKYDSKLLNLKNNTVKGDAFENGWGTKYSFLVVIESLGCDYERHTWWTNRKDKDLAAMLWGEQWEKMINNRLIYGDHNGNMFSVRDRFYMWSYWRNSLIKGKNKDDPDPDRVKSVSGYRASPAGKKNNEDRRTLDEDIRCEEQYNFGLCLNYIIADNPNGVFNHGKKDASGKYYNSPSVYGTSSAWQMTGIMNKATYGEFNRSKVEVGGTGHQALNHSDGTYDKSEPNVMRLTPKGYITNFRYSSPYDNPSDVKIYKSAVGGVAISYFVIRESLETPRIVDPFPTVAVRHIDSNKNTGTEDNCLLRDTITWTLPEALGLAIQSDLAKASFLTECKFLSEIKTGSSSEIINLISKYKPSILNRFGINNNYSSDILQKCLNNEVFISNGIEVQSIDIKELYNVIKDMKDEKIACDLGKSKEQSYIYYILQQKVIEHYKKYNIKIPLIANENTIITNNNDTTFWGVSAKPLTIYGGNLQYEDGSVCSENENNKSNILEQLEAFKQTNTWDAVSIYNNKYWGSAVKWTDNPLNYPVYRTMTFFDYSKSVDSDLNSSWNRYIIKDSRNARYTTYYYGTNMDVDRSFDVSKTPWVDTLTSNKYKEVLLNTVKGCAENARMKPSLIGLYTSLVASRNYTKLFSSGTLKSSGEVVASYYPSAKVYTGYNDTLTDVVKFQSSVQWATKNSISPLAYRKTTGQIYKADTTCNNMWTYQIDPRNSLLIKSLSNNNCVSNVIRENVPVNLVGDTDKDYLLTASENVGVETSIGKSLGVYVLDKNWKLPETDEETVEERVGIRQNMFFGIGSEKKEDTTSGNSGTGNDTDIDWGDDAASDSEASAMSLEDSSLDSVSVSQGRAYSSIWVPNLATYQINLAKAEFDKQEKKSLDQTIATQEMFTNYNEDIYSIALAYNPMMSSLEGWTYRLTDAYSDKVGFELKDEVGEDKELKVPENIKSVKAEDTNLNISTRDKSSDLDKMPDSILQIADINKEISTTTVKDNMRNFIKYKESDGWSPLRTGYFDNTGVDKLENLTSSKDTYILNTKETDKNNVNYITLNVASWLWYGDLGTIDAYYLTEPEPEIYDMELEIATTQDNIDNSTFDEIVSSDYDISKFKSIGPKIVFNPYPTVNMSITGEERGVSNEYGYKQTIKIIADTKTEIKDYFKTPSKLYALLNKTEIDCKSVDKVVNIKEDKSKLTKNDKLYYINIWVKADPSVKLDGTTKGYIRSDELTAAQIVTLPSKSIIMTASLSGSIPCDKSTNGNAHSGSASTHSLNNMTINFSEKSKLPNRLMYSAVVLSDKFTVLGTGSASSYTNKSLRMRWSRVYDGSLNTSVTKDYNNSGNSSGLVSGFETINTSDYTEYAPSSDVNLTFITHRSMVNENGEYLASPPLAQYMNNTASNTLYSKFMQEVGINPISAYKSSDIGEINANTRNGYTTAGRTLDINFNPIQGNSIGVEKGDVVASMKWTSQFKCKYNTLESGPHTHKASCSEDCTVTTDYWTEVHNINHSNEFSSVTKEGIASISWSTSLMSKGKADTLAKEIVIEPTVVSSNIQPKAVVDAKETFNKSGLQRATQLVEYRTPRQIKFNPTYIMRADYSEDNWEVMKKTPNQANGDRQKVWMLGRNTRLFNIENYHKIELIDGEETKVRAPWSTDKKDKEILETTNLPVVKAGTAYKCTDTTYTYNISSIVYLQDPNMVATEDKSAVVEQNNKMLKEHSDLVNTMLQMGNNKRTNDAYAFVYTSLPGGYDKELVNAGYEEFNNKFTNVINGTRHIYDTSEFSNDLKQTQTKIKSANAEVTSTLVSANYLNKNYETDKNYTNSDYASTVRSMVINVPNSGLFDGYSRTLNLTNTNTGSISTATDNYTKVMKNNLEEFDRLLEEGTDNNLWYKEDYEGIIAVKLSTQVTIKLTSDYSLVWGNSSDWTDSSPVQISTDDCPKNNNDLNIEAKIPSGYAGVGYGLTVNKVNINGHIFGGLTLLWQPYMFNIRGNIYDDIH